VPADLAGRRARRHSADALRLDPPDTEKLRALYSELEFHSLSAELESPVEEEEEVSFRELSPGDDFASPGSPLGIAVVPRAAGILLSISNGRKSF
jgi:hypothetical protein